MGEHPGAFQPPQTTPHEMGSEKGNVKSDERSDVRKLLKGIGSPYWTISATS